MAEQKPAQKPQMPAKVDPKMSTLGKSLLSGGVGVLAAGYMFLAVGSLNLAPVLIIGGLVIVGIGIYNL
jgi:hypothetical protein